MWAQGEKDASSSIRQYLAEYDFTGRVGELSYRAPSSNLRPAAVLVPLIWREQTPTVLLTRRADTLAVHGGQVSFPGGKVDSQDQSIIMTALRETREETGLSEDNISILGTLPEYVTATGFVVTPVVGMVQYPFVLQPEPEEVAEVFEAPLPLLMDTRAYQWQQTVTDEGILRNYLSLQWQQYHIWGATAAMLWLLADALKLVMLPTD
ncbi:CoA pyrophosphatase [Neisseriaceae bacterium TC5R-5]|nr:CoA pyrophosphatase [Neisseriaceae bacterium TC5R-5]